jgi:hypothetical protein
VRQRTIDPVRRAATKRESRPQSSLRETQLKCFCCDADVALGRQVTIRRLSAFDPKTAPGGPKAYEIYLEGMAYRSGVVCPPCYALLDAAGGTAKVGSAGLFELAHDSRSEAAPTLTDDEYQSAANTERSAI